MKSLIGKPDKRWALVTGANGSVGGACVRTLVNKKFRVIAIVKDSVNIPRIGEHLGVDESMVWALSANLGDDESWANALASIRNSNAHPAVVVNAAGEFGPMGDILDVSTNDLERVFSINFFGLVRLAHAFVPQMLQSKWGRLIHFSSPEGLGQPKYGDGPYSLSKAAGNRYLAHLALELTERNVNVHSVHPGEIRSNMWKHVRALSEGEPGLKRFADWAQMTQKKPGSLDSVGECISELLSDKTSRRLHGKFLWAQMPGKITPLG